MTRFPPKSTQGRYWTGSSRISPPKRPECKQVFPSVSSRIRKDTRTHRPHLTSTFWKAEQQALQDTLKVRENQMQFCTEQNSAGKRRSPRQGSPGQFESVVQSGREQQAVRTTAESQPPNLFAVDRDVLTALQVGHAHHLNTTACQGDKPSRLSRSRHMCKADH